MASDIETEARPILLVDDDFDVREALAEALEDRGFCVITATNGREALKLLREKGIRPAVVLLDLMMPIMDGYAFLDEQRRDASLAAIPVAVVTAGNAVDRDRIGPTLPIIAKPIKLALLESTLQKLQKEGSRS